MLNILLPIAGRSEMFDPKLFPYPVPLIEVLGKPIIQRVVENLSDIGDDIRFIFTVRDADCRRFHLDNTLSLLTDLPSTVIRIHGETRGALCSALMAVDYINNDEPLLVVNSDQIFKGVLPALFPRLAASGADAGCLCFDAVHPRWSYVRLDNDRVIEAAEKNPISRKAIAGFYYFSTGRIFVEAAKRTILNGRTVEDRFFLAPTFNELILAGKYVRAVEIPSDAYVSFFTPQRIEEFERSINKN